jgi:hypothetical protein
MFHAQARNLFVSISHSVQVTKRPKNTNFRFTLLRDAIYWRECALARFVKPKLGLFATRARLAWPIIPAENINQFCVQALAEVQMIVSGPGASANCAW